jgi:hypothetical protein
MVSSAIIGSFGRGLNEESELTHARRDALEGETEARRGCIGLRGQRCVIGLGKIDEALIVREVEVTQLGMTIDAEASDDQRLELADEEVGKIEAAGLRLGQCLEGLLARVAGIAMGSLEALHSLL